MSLNEESVKRLCKANRCSNNCKSTSITLNYRPSNHWSHNILWHSNSHCRRTNSHLIWIFYRHKWHDHHCKGFLFCSMEGIVLIWRIMWIIIASLMINCVAMVTEEEIHWIQIIRLTFTPDYPRLMSGSIEKNEKICFQKICYHRSLPSTFFCFDHNRVMT